MKLLKKMFFFVFLFVPKMCKSAKNETKIFLGYLAYSFVVASKKQTIQWDFGIKIFALELKLQTFLRWHDKEFDQQNKNIILEGGGPHFFAYLQKKILKYRCECLFDTLDGRRKSFTDQTFLRLSEEKYAFFLGATEQRVILNKIKLIKTGVCNVMVHR